MKNMYRCFLSLVLCMCMVFVLLPNIAMPAYAANSGTVIGLADESIGLSFSGDADNAWSASSTQIIGKARSTSGAGCGGGKDYSSTLTITNNKTTEATLSFDYTVVESEGTILVNYTTITTAGSFSQKLKAGGTVEVEIKSGSTSADTQITMSNVKLVADVSATVTFQPAENGSYTVNGKAITEAYTNTQSSMTAYQLVATPAEGYRFKGWYDVASGKCISTDAKTALNFDSDHTITARFVSKELALFETGGQIFDDLNDAIAEAQKKLPAIITLAESGKITGNYTIPSKVTLLIPFDAAKTCYTSTPTAITSTPAAKPFRTLTMAAGSSLTLANGAAISVGGQYCAPSGGASGKMVGPYGYIKMESGSAITVQSGANLYAWGFISGSGSVTVQSGGSVYEWYQVLDFRGGSASSAMGNKVFPFNQYAVQNVEVPLTLHAGASETVYTAVYAIRKINPTSIPFIGDKGMFKIVSGSLTKAYDGATDRIHYTIDGEAEVNSLNLKLAGASVSSSSYVLPLTNNMTINLNTGSKLTINQTAALLPGVETTIAKDAELVVSSGKSIYIYDRNEWGGYCGGNNAEFIPVGYAPGRTGKRAPLADVKVDVNGTLTAIGGIYTTAGGADICSSEGTGVYNQQGTPGTETKTYQYTQKGSDVTAHEIPITAAKLHNADGTYYETQTAKAGETINYVRGTWGGKPCTHENTELRGAKEPTCTEPGYTGDTYCKDCNDKIADGKAISALGHAWDDGVITTAPTCENAGVKTFTCTRCNETKTEAISATGHTSVQISEKPATCTEPGHKAGTKCSVCGAVLSGLEEIPAKGHAVVVDPAVEPTCTKPGKTEGKHCSVCNEVIAAQEIIPAKGHTVVIDSAVEPTCTKTGLTAGKHCSVCGEVIVAQKEIPAKGHHQVVRGAKNATLTDDGYTGDTYCSVCNELLKKGEVIPKSGAVITWVVNGTQTTQVYEKGKTPTFPGTPEKPETARYRYVFAGWDQEIVPVTSDATYTAQFTQVGKNGLCVEGADTYWIANGENVAFPGLIRINVGSEAQPHYHYYYFGEDGKAVKNGNYKVDKNNDLPLPAYQYCFNADGVIIHDDDTSKNGICSGDGSKYYYVDGVKVGEGLICVDGTFYYARTSNGEIVRDRDYWIAKTNGYPIEARAYHFDADGKMVIDGFVDIEGGTYYFVKGECAKGFTRIGEDYYFFNAGSGKMYKDATMWVPANSYGVEPGMHYFNAEGKMFVPDTVNGKRAIITENGKLYFTIDRVKMVNGLYELDGAYYFARYDGTLVTNGSAYVETSLLSGNGWYGFGADGKLIMTGFVTGDGKTYYYADGVRAKGLTKLGEDYYFFNAGSGMMYKDANMWVPANSYGVEPGMHYFDADGKMFVPDTVNGKRAIVAENGKLYFTIDGVKMTNGLYELDGAYYFAWYDGALVTNGSAYVETSLLSGNGWYGFGADGRLIMTGFVTGDGKTYYYADGVRAKGLTKIGEDYYFFNAGSGMMYKDATMWVPANSYGVEPGMHYFDADGKMFVPDTVNGKRAIVAENGKLYFTIDGVKMTNGLYELDGAYYFARYDGTLVTNGSAYVETSLLSGNGWYGFGADGKLIKTGFVTGSGKTYYYADGVRAKGLTKIGEDYYFFNAGSGMMYKDATMWVPANSYGVEPGMHYFGADGKMAQTAG